MKYVTKELEQTLSVTGIVNLHFFEFGKDFATEGERHPFYELVFVNSGKLYISSDDYTGYLKKHQLLIHRASSEHSLRCDVDNAPTVIILGFECSSDMINPFSSIPVSLDDEKVKKLAEIVKEGRNVFMPPYNIPVYDMKKRKKQASRFATKTNPRSTDKTPKRSRIFSPPSPPCAACLMRQTLS